MRVIWIRFIGQERDKTTIRLKDNAPGFGAGADKAVIAYGKSAFNNRKAINALRNLTVDVGKGNAGAVAVDFTGANARADQQRHAAFERWSGQLRFADEAAPGHRLSQRYYH